MKVEDVMTADVITVRPDALVREAARLMTDHGVSGLPVVDSTGFVLGIVSEGDLILRQAAPRARDRTRRVGDDGAGDPGLPRRGQSDPDGRRLCVRLWPGRLSSVPGDSTAGRSNYAVPSNRRRNSSRRASGGPNAAR